MPILVHSSNEGRMCFEHIELAMQPLVNVVCIRGIERKW